MKELIKSAIMAFSMFSILPMPQITWDEKSYKYILLAFPWVGLLCGCFFVLVLEICGFFGFSNLFISVCLLLTPIIFTGGIHLDGYCDTIDAKSSYQNMEKKLEILKDPHIGAFALMGLLCYFFLQFSIFYDLEKTSEYYPVFVVIFVISRCFSGLLLVLLPTASTSIMVRDTKEKSSEILVQVVLVFYLLLVFLGLFLWNIRLFLGVFLCSIFVIFSWFYGTFRKFGGVTGDLCGYFSQKLELYLFLTLLIWQKGMFL